MRYAWRDALAFRYDDAMKRGNSNSKRRRTAIRKAARKSCKWGGAVVTVLLIVVWIGSPWYQAHVGWFKTKSYISATVYIGTFFVYWDEHPAAPPFTIWYLERATGRQWERWLSLRGQWGVGRDQVAKAATDVTLSTVAFPIWLPLVVVLVGTCLVWRADIRAMRRAREGLCAACGYDLVGVVGVVGVAGTAAVCPECGKARSA